MSKRGRKGARGQQEVVWRERVARQAASGETIAEFCRSEGITASSFYMWRSRQRRRAIAKVDAAGGFRAPAKFIDVGTINGQLAAGEGSRPAPAGRIELRLDLGGGMVLHLMRQ